MEPTSCDFAIWSRSRFRLRSASLRRSKSFRPWFEFPKSVDSRRCCLRNFLALLERPFSRLWRAARALVERGPPGSLCSTNRPSATRGGATAATALRTPRSPRQSQSFGRAAPCPPVPGAGFRLHLRARTFLRHEDLSTGTNLSLRRRADHVAHVEQRALQLDAVHARRSSCHDPTRVLPPSIAPTQVDRLTDVSLIGRSHPRPVR